MAAISDRGRAKRDKVIHSSEILLLILILTAITLIGFAANSLLCRIALGGHLIDPVSFTTLRLISGALALFPLSRLITETKLQRTTKSALASAFALLTYASAFSLAYLSLSTGTGALILFGSVQVTMIAAALVAGERLRVMQWLGSAAALGGLVYLVSPGLTAPDLTGALLMCVSGISWGVYSLRGMRVASPVTMTASNFLWAAPLALVISAVALSGHHWQPSGLILAVSSGGVASAIPYVLWYRVLRNLTTTQASILQLLVPVLAAFGGVVVLDERISLRLLAASAVILGGVAVAVLKRHANTDTPR